jgi:long-chain acyl-CoA synthetase
VNQFMPLLFDWLMKAVERRSTSNNPGQALIYHDTYLSFRGLLHRVDRRARELGSLGVRQGDWVGLLLGNDPELVVLILALSKLEAVPVPLDPTMGTRDLELTLATAPMRALVTRPNAIEPFVTSPGALRVEKTSPPPRVIPENKQRLTGTLLSCTIYPTGVSPIEGTFLPDVVLFTMDSGGDPKAVLRGPDQLWGIAASLTETLGLNSDARVLCSAPLYDSQGFDFGLIAALFHGATLYLDDGNAGPRIAKMLLDQDISLFITTPREYAALSRVTTARSLEGQHTQLLCSGPPLPDSVAIAFQRRFGLPITSCYQTCEAGPITINRSAHVSQNSGLPFSKVEIQVRMSDGELASSEQPGSVWVRSPSVTTHFLPIIPPHGSQIPIGRTSPEGWLRTGDRGVLDKEGNLQLIDREDDLVQVDRRQVALGEVESCLERVESVRAAQAHVEYDDSGSARIVVNIVPDGRCRSQTLMEYCAKQLAPHKVPSRIEISKPVLT